MSTIRNVLADVMLGVLFIAGLIPLASNTAANFITGRDVHVFPGWVVVVGVAVSLVIANIANDRVSKSAARMGEAVGKYLPIGRAGDGK